MLRGLLISFEGVEACGKSTQIRLLADRLGSAGFQVELVREPGGTPLGEKLRHLLKYDPDGRGMAPETELLLMNASRSELVRRVIRPALAAGTIVLSDRFLDSTIAYQGAGRGLNDAVMTAVIGVAVGDTRPDLTVWLRVPPTEAAERLQSRSAGAEVSGDRFEEEHRTFFERVERAYLSLARAEPNRFVPVDGSGSPEEVAERIWSVVAPRVHR